MLKSVIDCPDVATVHDAPVVALSPPEEDGTLFLSSTSPTDLFSRGISSVSPSPFHSPVLNAVRDATFVEDTACLSESDAADWRSVAEACPRDRWTPDSEAHYCEQARCSVRFGMFGLPGISFSTSQRKRTRSMDAGAHTGTQFANFDGLGSAIGLSGMSRETSSSALDSRRRLSSSSTLSSIEGSLTSDQGTLFRPFSPPTPSKVLGSQRISSKSTAFAFPPLSMKRHGKGYGRTSTELEMVAPEEDHPVPSTPTLSSHAGFMLSSSLETAPSAPLDRVTLRDPISSTRSPIKLHRRHHCRRCGACFCSEHSSNVTTLILPASEISSGGDEEQRLFCGAEEGKADGIYDTSNSKVDDKTRSTSAKDTLKDILEQHISSKSSVPRYNVDDTLYGRFIRSRVCDGCFVSCQRARHRYLGARLLPVASDTPRTSPLLSLQISQPQARRAGRIDLSSFAFPTFTSTQPSTPTILEEDDEEYFASKHRIWEEKKREQKELLKALCKIPSANYIAAAAAAAQAGELNVLHACTAAPARHCDARHAISTQPDARLGSNMVTMTKWEKATCKRQEEDVARIALSLDSLFIRGLEHSQRIEEMMHQQKQFRGSATSRQTAERDEYAEVDLCKTNLDHIISPSGMHCVWGARSPAPQPHPDAHRASTCEAVPMPSMPSLDRRGVAKNSSVGSSPCNREERSMGKNRLQRSFLVSQVSLQKS